MKRPAKLLLGALTIWPIIYGFLFLCSVIGLILWQVSQPQAPGPPSDGEPPAWFMVGLVAAHLGTMLEIFALGVFYVYHLYHNDRVEKQLKAFWAVIIILGNMLAMPVYWYLYVWRDGGAKET